MCYVRYTVYASCICYVRIMSVHMHIHIYMYFTTYAQTYVYICVTYIYTRAHIYVYARIYYVTYVYVYIIRIDIICNGLHIIYIIICAYYTHVTQCTTISHSHYLCSIRIHVPTVRIRYLYRQYNVPVKYSHTIHVMSVYIQHNVHVRYITSYITYVSYYSHRYIYVYIIGTHNIKYIILARV